jgi:hypothetical protein
VISGRVAETRTRAELRLRELFTVEEPAPEEPEEGRGGVRLGIDRRAVAALVVIALGGVVLAGAVVLRSQPHVTEVSPPTVIAVG